jgi:hypothetical protein
LGESGIFFTTTLGDDGISNSVFFGFELANFSDTLRDGVEDDNLDGFMGDDGTSK